MAKANVFLDLDNTLLSAVPITDIKWDQTTVDLATEFPFHNMEDYYLVFERPGLQNFLDFLFSTFNVNVWSAATKDYVLFIVEKILLQKPGRKVDYILFSYHCDKCKKDRKGSVKLLDFLWDRYSLPGITPENTFIIDDNDRVAAFNPNNVVHIKEFEFEDGPKCKDDAELEPLKKRLQLLADDFSSTGKLNLDILAQAHSAPADRRAYAMNFNSDDATDDESSEESDSDNPKKDEDTTDDDDQDKLDKSAVVDEDEAKEKSMLLDDDDALNSSSQFEDVDTKIN